MRCSNVKYHQTGLDEALRRARAFAEAGADILFVEAPESEAPGPWEDRNLWNLWDKNIEKHTKTIKKHTTKTYKTIKNLIISLISLSFLDVIWKKKENRLMHMFF